MQFPPSTAWFWWQKIIFRFFFIYFLIFLGPWDFIGVIPYAELLTKYCYQAIEELSLLFNKLIFHIPPATKPPNGNGDFPEQWMQVCTSAFLAATGCIVWSILDRKRSDYRVLNYWFSLGVRYALILTGFIYGFIKIFGLQMPFPSTSQMATALGDFLPMRFSWLFIGYSYPYQCFSGIMEVLAAVLLLFRRTATIGVLVATAVFANVMMLNLAYDIPVKINSISLFVLCLYLLAQETPRLYNFFFKHQAAASTLFIWPFETKRERMIARVAKGVFVVLVLYNQLSNDIEWYAETHKPPKATLIPTGFYEVIQQTRDSMPVTASMPDSVYWQNIVFDNERNGSIKAHDSRFSYRYGRNYFSYKLDSAERLIYFKASGSDTATLARFTFTVKDSVLVELASDSMTVLLRRKRTPFPLSEKPFHWVSETNR